jgi:putative peptidoglycan lipid II flippase
VGADQPRALPRSSGRTIAVAALIISAGNLLSRLLALLREQVIAAGYGNSPELNLFTILSAIPTQLYDMLVGGLLSAALIPVFSEYAEETPEEFWHIVRTVITIIMLGLMALGAVVWLFPQLFVELLATQTLARNPQLVPQARTALRIMIVAVLFMGLKGLFEAILQSQRRFLLPALATSLFNIGMIAAALLFQSAGMLALAIGMLLGAAAQVLVQLPGIELRQLRPALDLRHPAVRRIGRLYLPVAAGMSFSLLGVSIDRRLADAVGEPAASVMRYATTLIQLTLGLIAAAVGLAILPTLSRLGRDQDEPGFRRTFGMGLKVVLVLIAPALALLGALATPVVRLLFEHGKFDAHGTRLTALALLIYLPSLLAAAVDQLLIFAFYARKNTLLPNLVQGVAVATYLGVALWSYQRYGMYGLIAANVLQHTAHMTIMLWLGQRRFQLLRGERIGETLWKVLLAAALAAAAAALGAGVAGDGGGSKLAALLQTVVGGGAGVVVYVLLLSGLKVEALGFLRQTLSRKARGTRPEVPTD